MPRQVTLPLALALLALVVACTPGETGSIAPRIEGTSLSVAEHSPVGTLVGTLTATVAEGRKSTVRLTNGDPGGVFALDADGRLTVANAQALDFETSPSFTLTVEVTDDAAPPGTDSAQVVVTVTDVNEAPQLAGVTFDLSDKAEYGAIVGTLVVADPDAQQTYTFAILDGNAGDTFELDATSGLLTVASSALLDHDRIPSFTLEVRVTDSGTPALTAEATVTVNITDGTDPLVVSGGPFSVDEHTPEGSLVGALSVAGGAGEPSFELVGGNTGGAFGLDAATGALVVANPQALDFETTPAFALAVRVTDEDAQFTEATVAVTLNDVNEAPTLADATFHLSEGADNGATVGALVVVEPDARQSHVFAIVGGNTGDTFAVDTTSGLLTVASKALLDADVTPAFVLTVRATDSGTPALSDDATVTVNIVASADRPTVSGGPFSVDEHRPTGSPVGTLVATGGTGAHSFELVGGNTGGAFDLDASTGALRVANQQALDFETTPVFTLAVRATDARGLTADANVTVSLNDVNEAPTLSGGPFTVAENSAAGTIVGTLTAADADAGQAVSLSIVAGNEQGAFAVSGLTLMVASPTALDFETRKAFALTLRATDDAASPLSVDLTVEVQLSDVNEAPVPTGGRFTVTENSVGGTEIGVLSATDVDEGQTVTLSIVAGDEQGRFALSGKTLVVAQGAVLDFEETPAFTLTVRATDDGVPSLSSDVQIVVELDDVNEAPATAGGLFTLAENSLGGTEIGALSVTDVDDGQTVTLSIVAGDEEGRFAFSGHTLVVAEEATLDFETTPILVLTVRATDDGTPPAFSDAQITVQLVDVNEAPTLADATLSVNENALPGYQLGVLSANDPDAGQSHAFELVAGNDGGTFALHPTTGALTVIDNTLLDFETRAQFTLSVQATDDGTPGLSTTRAFTVSVVDVAEPPTLADTTFTLPEHSPEGTLVGVLTASDPDAGDTVVLTLKPGHAGVFALSTTGHLIVIDPAALDFETNESFILPVRATDVTGLVAEATVRVELLDVNEPPRLSANTTRVSVSEDVPAGWQLVKLTTDDDDAGQTVSLSIQSGNEGGAFALLDGWLVVDDLTAFDYEMNPSFDLTIRATDDGSPALHADLAVEVQLEDVNEAPAVTAGQSFRVPSDATVGLTVGHLEATDPDQGQSLTWAFSSGEAIEGYFGVDASTGRLYVAAVDGAHGPLPDLAGQSWSLSVRAVDDGSPPAAAEGTVTMTVNGSGEPPSDGELVFLAYTDRVYTMNIADQASLGTPAARVVSFGGDWLGTTYPAGTKVEFGGGSIKVDEDGTISIASYHSGSLPFTIQVQNTAGTANLDVLVWFCVALEPGGVIHYAQWPYMCLKGDAEYVLVPSNLADANAANLTVTATNIVPVVGAPTPVVNPMPGALALNALPVPGASAAPIAKPTRDESFDAALRRQEKEILEPLMAAARTSRQRGPNLNIVPEVPSVGDFMTLNAAIDACDVPDNRTGRVEAVSTRAIVINEWKTDKSAAVVSGGFAQEDFEAIANAFDQQIWPVIAGTFGTPVDIDNNGRVIIFYTTAVNQLTEPDSGSYIGGFVHTRDVYPQQECPTSNAAEMFYMLSPDPSGLFGNAFPTDFVLDVTYGTLAHEFQHLINASRRLYVNYSPGFETVWLNEGLSHIAEELMFYDAAETTPGQNLGLNQILSSSTHLDAFNGWAFANFSRLQSWLEAPEEQGPFADNDTLATRGAIWAFLRYAADRKGGDQSSLWSSLANSRTKGLANLDEVLEDDATWWIGDFAQAMYLDDAGLVLSPRYQQPSWNFRSIMPAMGGNTGYPLAVRNAVDGAGTALTLSPGGGSAYVRLGVAEGQHAELWTFADGETPPETVRLSLIRRK